MASIVVNFPVIDYERFTQAVVCAAQAHTKFRFNLNRTPTYFFDALKYYYESDEVLKIPYLLTVRGPLILLHGAPEYVNLSFAIPFENRKKRILIRGDDVKYPIIRKVPSKREMFGSDDVDYIIPDREPIETMILAIGSQLPGPLFPFPRLENMLYFPPNENTIQFRDPVTFVDPSFTVQMLDDFNIINRISTDAEFLRANINNEMMITVVLGAPLACRANLVEYLFETLPADVLKYYAYYLGQIATANASREWRQFLFNEISLEELILFSANIGNMFNTNVMTTLLNTSSRETILELLPRFNINLFNFPDIVDAFKRLEIPPALIKNIISRNRKKYNFNSMSYSLEEFIGTDLNDEFLVESTLYQNDYPVILANPAIEEISLDFVDVNEMKFLGKGTYGTVYGNDGDPYVYKVFNADRFFEGELASLNYMNRYLVNFTNLSRVICYDSKNKIFQCMRLVPLPKRVNPFTPYKHNLPIFLQLAQGLNSLHSSGLMHTDIKRDNVMMTPDGHVEFIDFGFLQTICKPIRSIPRGTYAYCPPESFINPDKYWEIYEQNPQKVLQSHDIWSMILTVYELVLGMYYLDYMKRLGYRQNTKAIVTTFFVLASQENPFSLPIYANPTATEITREPTENIAACTPSGFLFMSKVTSNENIKSLINRCLRHDPNERASALDILSIINYIPETIAPCLRADLIDCSPFTHYRTFQQRQNWVALCHYFSINPLKYIQQFESKDIPSDLCYVQYFAILSACLKLDYVVRPLKYEYFDLPNSVPINVANDIIFTEFDLVKLVANFVKLLNNVPMWVPPNKVFDNVKEDFYFMLETAYVNGDLASKSGTEVLNL